MTDPTYASDAEPTAAHDDRGADEERPTESAPDGGVALGGAGFGVSGPEDVHDDPDAEPGVGDAI